MRVFVLATMLLASSSLCVLAQEQGKAPAATPQAGTPGQIEAPAPTDQKSSPQPDQDSGRAHQRTDDRETGRDGKMRRSDGDRMDRDERDTGHGGMMRRGDSDRMDHGERQTGTCGMMRRDDSDRFDQDRGRYLDRGDRESDRADRDRSYRGYADADRPRRRVKICVEYDNGEEYCRYRR